MAKIGLKYPVVSPMTENGNVVTYGTGFVLAKAISLNISIENSDIKLWADDSVAETDRCFASGTVSLGVDDLYDNAKVMLLDYISGVTVDVGTGAKELSAGASSPAYVGFGVYGKVVRNGVNYWRAIWLKKVQFAEPSDELKTKGESTEFLTPELEGSILMASDGLWKEEATFPTEKGAKDWLDGKSGIVEKVANVVSTVQSGTYTTTQSVELSTATAGAKVYYTQDGTIPTEASTQYSSPISLTSPANKCIKAIGIKSGLQNSDILELYIKVQS